MDSDPDLQLNIPIFLAYVNGQAPLQTPQNSGSLQALQYFRYLIVQIKYRSVLITITPASIVVNVGTDRSVIRIKV